MITSASVKGRSSPRSPTSGSASAAFSLVGVGLRVLAPRKQRCEALADRDDRAGGVLDDPERREPGREELDRAEQREVPALLDQDEHEPEQAREQRARDRRDPTDHEGQHNREPGQHRELRLVDRLVVLGEERAREPRHAGRQHEHRDLRLQHVHAHGRGGGFAVAERDEPASERAAAQRDERDPDDPEHGGDEEEERAGPVEVHPEQVKALRRPALGPEREGLDEEHELDQ